MAPLLGVFFIIFVGLADAAEDLIRREIIRPHVVKATVESNGEGDINNWPEAAKGTDSDGEFIMKERSGPHEELSTPVGRAVTWKLNEDGSGWQINTDGTMERCLSPGYCVNVVKNVSTGCCGGNVLNVTSSVDYSVSCWTPTGSDTSAWSNTTAKTTTAVATTTTMQYGALCCADDGVVTDPSFCCSGVYSQAGGKSVCGPPLATATTTTFSGTTETAEVDASNPDFVVHTTTFPIPTTTTTIIPGVGH